KTQGRAIVPVLGYSIRKYTKDHPKNEYQLNKKEGVFLLSLPNQLKIMRYHNFPDFKAPATGVCEILHAGRKPDSKPKTKVINILMRSNVTLNPSFPSLKTSALFNTLMNISVSVTPKIPPMKVMTRFSNKN